jgi:hypothetical protein
MEADMSWNPSLDPVCPDAVAVEAIDTLIVPRAHDIGGATAAGLALLLLPLVWGRKAEVGPT